MTYVPQPVPLVLLGAMSGQSGGNYTLVTDVAAFVYILYTTQPLLVNYINIPVRNAGVGAQTAEVGLFSSTGQPSYNGHTLTKLTATGVLGALTAAGMVRNTNPLAYTVNAGVYLWAGIRTAMAVTQPSICGIMPEQNAGFALTTAAAGVLTGAGPWVGAANAVAVPCSGDLAGPDLRLSFA